MELNPLKYLRLFLITILIGALLTQLNPTAQLERPGQVDLLEYWAAAKLIENSENPYDSEKIEKIQRAEPTTGKTLDSPILMWNPPFVAPMIKFLGNLNFEEARIWWTSMTFLALFLSIFLIMIAENFTLTWKTIVALMIFFPAVSILQFGQISWILILGLATGLVFLNRQNGLLAGLSLSVCLIKPHLLYLTYLSFLFSLPTERRFKFILGFLSGGAILAASAELIAPGIWNQWLAAFEKPPVYFKTPTIGSLMQNLIGAQHGWVVYLPAAITLLVLILFRHNSKCAAAMRDPIGITALSLATAPYGWVFDQVLLLPLVIRLTSRRDLFLPLTVIFLNIQGFSPWMPNQDDYWWYPLVLFALSLLKNNSNRENINKAFHR
jgi:hypothetical protein